MPSEKAMRLLGEAVPELSLFPNLDETISKLNSDNFSSLSLRQKFREVNKLLLSYIQEHSSPCFLLAAVLEFIDRINAQEFSEEAYSLQLFEFWLNHFGGLSRDEILEVRGKIVGRYIPRDEYQSFFPVGMGKVFSGSHFVAAHLSPDVDTTVSSFWGWVDAFGCRVSEGTHQWSLPKGLTDGHIQLFFKRLFGDNALKLMSRSLPTMTLTALDVLSTKKIHKVLLSDRADSIEYPSDEHAIVVVDEMGLYQGEWRTHDAEAVRHIVAAFSSCLRWFEGQCQARLIHALADDQSTAEMVACSYTDVLNTVVAECGAVGEIPEQTKTNIHKYLSAVLGLSKGVQHTFRELLEQLDVRVHSSFADFFAECEALSSPKLFDEKGLLKGSRVQVTQALEKVVFSLENALGIVRDAIERLSHLLEVKNKVVGKPSVFVTLKSDVDEMRSKIDHYEYLTVVTPETNGSWYPVGVVFADDVYESMLGTVSFRDFSNPEETKMASYLEVISIIDHHKMRIQTSSAPTLLIGDAQSTNTLLAEQSLKINRQYSTGGDGYFVDEKRELSEYFFYLFGILDDTDLLTKISRKDVLVVKSILDRMRTIVNGLSSESVSFSHFRNDSDFVKNAAKALVQSHDLHSIYARVYQYREMEVEEALVAAISHKPSTIFLDTKEQNGCCRVGQTKLFRKNLETFDVQRDTLMELWHKGAMEIHSSRPNIDFFLHMISTVPGEKEVFIGEESLWDHQDEIWIWTPEGGLAEQHLVGFLNAFRRSKTAQTVDIDVQFVGTLAEERKNLFKQNFSQVRELSVEVSEGPTFAIFRYKAGAMNSRKSQVSPFLPKVIP